MTRLTWKETLLSLLSGTLTAFAMPGFGVFPLIFVSLVPLFFVLDKRGGFWPGFTFGCAFFAIDLRWIATLARFHPIVIGGYVLLVVYFAIGCGILGAMLAWRRHLRIPTWLILAPALFVLAEYLRTLGPLGMGFSALYQSLYRVPCLIQSASVFGPWFISGIVVAVNGSLFVLFRKRDYRFAFLAGGFVILLATFSLLPRLPQGTDSMRVAVVSSKVQQEVKLDTRNLNDLATRYLQLGDEALAADPDLVVFPESILPVYILQNETLKNSFADLARRGETQILLGTGVYQDRKIYNGVALFSTMGELVGTFHMVRPVPFGEYIPGRSILEWLGLGTWARSFLPLDLSRGDGYVPLAQFGTPICFESTFPGPSRQLTKNGAQVLVTVTNDAWFDESSELAVHFSCAVFRAVENRRWVVQAANGGISGIVSPVGRIVKSIDVEGVISGDIQLRTEASLYTQWGDWIVLLGACVLTSGILLRRMIPRKRKRGQDR
ncbi:apolipoprotein N-acyltransferase [Candidatus Bipolaricaulota bacterium]|nr:apolipoprotein N-acyltransferase [Candidatus Bipolaricaulota bacterium]